MNQIKFLDLHSYHKNNEEIIIKSLQQNVFDDTSFIHGKSVTNFEKKFAEYIGVKHCIGVGNGTDALEIALHALGIKDGDEVITQANTFISTVFAIKSVRATPVLVDCDENFMIDVGQIESKITSKTRCIIPVHMYGHTANMDIIMDIAKKHNLYVVEDCAQAHGALYAGKCVGSFGDIGCFSFYPGKNLGAYGDGGAIVTNSDELAIHVRKIGNIGSIIKYNHEIFGRNSRLDSIQAEILNVKLPDLNMRNNRRQYIAKLYDEQLKDVDGITLHSVSENCTPVYHLYVIRTSKRDELKKYLQANGVECGIHYPIPVHKSQALSDLNELTFPLTEKYSNEILSLPMYSELDPDDVSYISCLIKLFPKPPVKIDLTTISFFGHNEERKKITEKFLHHICFLQNELRKSAILLSLTFVASDGSVSKAIYDTYFGSDRNSIYIEYAQQHKYRKQSNFNAMLNHKLGMAITKSFEKKCNLSVITGSNDFYSKDFFIQIAEKYDPNIEQVFTLNNSNELEGTAKTFRIQCINDKLINNNNFINMINTSPTKFGEYTLTNVAQNNGAVKGEIYNCNLLNNPYKIIDKQNSWIHIDYVTVSYYGDNIPRKLLTERFLQYITYLKKVLIKRNIKLTLTFVASDGNDSRSLFKNYFSDSDDSEDTYIEYYQKSFTKYYGNPEFFDMLHNKCYTAIKYSTSKNPNLLVFSGSNDFYSEEFFIQICQKYNKNEKQYFAINETNEKNNIYNFMCVFPVDTSINIIPESDETLYLFICKSSRIKLKSFYSEIYKKNVPYNHIANVAVFNDYLLCDDKFLNII
jgi:dTDP-4-amino-4,6-dideoxygalactose transaminase